MLILADKALRAAGLDFATAVGLMAPAEGELVIHVRQELDDSAPPEPQTGDIDVPPPAGLPGETLPVIPGAAADRTSAAEPQADVDSVYTSTAPAPSSTVDYRGFDFRAAERMAKEQRLDLVMVGGVYTLSSVLGQRHYSSLADVVQALRLRRY